MSFTSSREISLFCASNCSSSDIESILPIVSLEGAVLVVGLLFEFPPFNPPPVLKSSSTVRLLFPPPGLNLDDCRHELESKQAKVN